MHSGSLITLLSNRWNWIAPNRVATINGVFWMVRMIMKIDRIHAKYLFLTKNGKKQKLTFYYLFSPVNLKIQIMTIGTQPMLKK